MLMVISLWNLDRTNKKFSTTFQSAMGTGSQGRTAAAAAAEALDLMIIKGRRHVGGGGATATASRKSTSDIDAEATGVRSRYYWGSRKLAAGGNGGKVKASSGAGRKSVSDAEATVDCVAAFLRVRVMAADMPESMQVHAFRCARRSHDGLEKLSTRQIAHDVKKEFDKTYGPLWHCIVGTSFGSFVTHSRGCFLYFSMEKLIVMLFKTRDPRDQVSPT